MMDTYTTVKHLEQAGIEEDHAAAIAYVVLQEHDELVTKADIADFPTRADLVDFATKADLVNFATKADLVNFATKADIADFATKSDIKVAVTNLEKQIVEVKSEVEKTEERMNAKFADVNSTVADMKSYLTVRLSALVGGCTAIILGAMKWL